MKKVILLIIVVSVISNQLLFADDTLKVSKPSPLQEKIFKFPEYQMFFLDNGLKVFVFEDHRQPTLAFRLLTAGGKSIDTVKPGIADITASLLTKGTKKLNSQEFAQSIDGIGADISAEVETDFLTVTASGLKKHLNTLLDLYVQAITSPALSEQEFKKIIPQMIASIQQEKSNPEILAQKMSRKVVYGENHPYALDATEESVNKINLYDIENYYSGVFYPNNSTLVVTGDVKSDEIIKEIKKKFKNWEKSKEDIKISIPPIKPIPIGVYFIERPGSVQSTILYSTKTVPYTHKDYDILELATNIISGGIAGRLFKVLREEYSYTYTPYGNLTQNKFSGRYFCGADVKKEVTDSALFVLLKQINSLTKNLVPEQELSRVKTYLAGTFKMSFESSEYLAMLIQNADFYGKDIKELESFTGRIMGFAPNSIRSIANQYLNTSKGYIIVVGSSEVKEKLSQFGKMYDFDLNLNPLSGDNAKMEPVSMTFEDLIGKYIKAIGGLSALETVQTVIDTANVEMISSGNVMKGLLIQYQKAPNKKYMNFDMNVFKQEIWVDGQEVWIKLNKVEKMKSDEAEKILYDAYLFKDAKLIEQGFKCTVLGKQGNQILMKALSPKGFVSTYYFDAKTYLINKIERVETTAEGTIPITEHIKEYIEIEGVKLPKVTETISPLYTIKTNNHYLINQPLEDVLFKPVQ